jgi:SAM-dependent methyltransferase
MLPVVASGVSLSSGSLCGVRNLPDDPAARRIWLERWAAEQEANRSATRPAGAWRRLALVGARVRLKSGQLARRVSERGLDFEGGVSGPEHDHPDRRHYAASPWRTLPRALGFLGVSDRDTFVDFGCGKGRIIHQAAKRPFRRVIGVEISRALAEIARANLATRRHQHRCPNVEIVVADAKEFRVPDDLTIAYFWDPFKGETFEAVLRGIIDSIDRRPRRVRLIYLGPHPAQLLETGRFRLLKEQSSGGPDPTMIFESL